MHVRSIPALVITLSLTAAQPTLTAQQPGAPKGIESEQSLPDRYPYVVEDILKYCKPEKGFWIDLGSGKGQLSISLIEATGNPVVMIDPDIKAMSEGLRIAKEKGLGDRLFAVIGTAEKMPFPDNSVDLVVSRGSIFFWSDQAQGLREIYRILRPGGSAMIGGGAGSGYPKEAVGALIRGRKEKLKGEDADRWARFVELRRPEKMRNWATQAKIPDFKVAGKGALSADDPQVGQGVWLWFTKQQ